MGWSASSSPLSCAALAFIFGVCIVSAATAGEAVYCVTCKGPDQTYRCQVTGQGSRPNEAFKLYCIIRTAHEGHHSSCSAERPLAACYGEAKVYTYDGPSIPQDIASDPRARSLMGRIDQQQQAFDNPKGEAPKTLVELTGRAVSASRKGLRNARSAIGGSPAPADEPLPQNAAMPPEPLPLSPAPQSAEPIAVEASAASAPNRVRRASEAVGGAARKSFRCVVSLFRNCRGEPEGEAWE